MFKLVTYLVVLGATFTACSPMKTKDVNLINEKPILRLGDKNIPANGDYILFIKSGQKVPMVIDINGDIFINRDQFKSTMVMKKDMYLYKLKVSYNGRDWYHLKKLLDMRLSASVSTTGGKFKIQINKRLKKSK